MPAARADPAFFPEAPDRSAPPPSPADDVLGDNDAATIGQRDDSARPDRADDDDPRAIEPRDPAFAGSMDTAGIAEETLPVPAARQPGAEAASPVTGADRPVETAPVVKDDAALLRLAPTTQPGNGAEADGAARISVQATAADAPSKPASALVPQAVLAVAAPTPDESLQQVAQVQPATAPTATGAAAVQIVAPAPGPAVAAPAPAQALPIATGAEPSAAETPAAVTVIDAGTPTGGPGAGLGDAQDSPSGFTSRDGNHGDEGSQSFASVDPRAPAAAASVASERTGVIRTAAAQVVVPLIKAAKAGLHRIEISLEPATLGRVDVRLDFARDGRISALFLVDTPAALDALKGDARALERALADAGVKADTGSLGFGLREQGSGSDSGHHNGSGRPPRGGPDRSETVGEALPPADAAPRTGQVGHLDIHA